MICFPTVNTITDGVCRRRRSVSGSERRAGVESASERIHRRRGTKTPAQKNVLMIPAFGLPCWRVGCSTPTQWKFLNF